MLVYLLSCIIVTLALMLLLYKLGIRERYMIFTGFAVFGLLAGTFSGLAEHSDGLIISNIIGVYLGDEVYVYAINHLGDPSSSQAHYTIPWIFRIPQVYLFTSLISYSFIGLVIQIAYNMFKKPKATPRTRVAMITVIAFILCVVISAGTVYATQSEDKRHGSSSPYAYQVTGTGTSGPGDSEWNAPGECDVEELS